jgi:WD40 repeat protein
MPRLTTIHRVPAHHEGVWSLAWVPGGSGSQLLTGSVDERVKLWEDKSDSLAEVHAYSGYALGVVSVTAHPRCPQTAGAIALSVCSNTLHALERWITATLL